MDSPNPLHTRVLTRLSPAPFSVLSSSADPASAPATAPSQPRFPDGVVVVGFIGRRPDASSQLINRVLDSNVFGQGNLDKSLTVDKDEVKEWFKCRRISYYHEEEKGILFLQFFSTDCPAFDGFLEPGSGFDSIVEEREFGDLQGLLFMFSVTPPFPVVLATCPVIQFERSCLPPSTSDCEEKLQFSLGYPVILPPESFLTLRLPFVYGIQQEDRSLLPLRPFEQYPEATAWVLTGTTLQVISKGSSSD